MTRREKIKKEFQPEWTTACVALSDSPYADDALFESYCMGWCFAQGLTLSEAHDFYQDMIEAGVY